MKVKIIDDGGVYSIYEEMGKKFETDELKFEVGFAPETDSILELICSEEHPIDGNVISVCKTENNKIVLIDEYCVVAIK